MDDIKSSIHESLDNAIANGDDQFLYSLETRNIHAIVEDMCDCDADVEHYVNSAADRRLALLTVTEAVTEWVDKDQGRLL